MNKTCDISDALHPQVQYLESGYQSFGAKSSFSGRIQTVKCFEDNSLVRDKVSSNGAGCVLVVDAGGSERCAMLGDMLAAKAVENGWTPLHFISLYGKALVQTLVEHGANVNEKDK